MAAAPLLETPDNPAPPGGEAVWFEGADGARLRAALFTPKGAARGTVVLSGGRTEVIEKYFETIGELLERGFAVLTHDWRGQGLSHRSLDDPLKGHAVGYEEFLLDYERLLAQFPGRLPKPWVAMGHSMGGCLTLLALAKGQAARFDSAILSAPMLGLKTGPAPRFLIKLLLARRVRGKRLGDYIGRPTDPLADDFADNKVTHDARRFARNCAVLKAHPQLALGAPTWGWLDFAFRAIETLQQRETVAGVAIPVVICQAMGDEIVKNRGQDRVLALLPNGKAVRIAAAKHEILQETDDVRARFWAAFDALAAELTPAETAAKALGEKLTKAAKPKKAPAKP
jgi:lysophospholipase